MTPVAPSAPDALAPAAPVAASPVASASTVPAPAVHDPNARMTPAVRRLLREHGLEAAQVAGTGGGGRITREDVLAHVEAARAGATSTVAPGAPAATPAAPTAAPAAPTAAAAPAAAAKAVPGAPIEFPSGADEVLVPMTQMRKGIAAQMTRALAAPARLRADGDRRQPPRPPARGHEEGLPGEGGRRHQLRPVRRQGCGRGPQAQPHLQRPLDRPGTAGQAPDHDRRGGRRGRRAHRPGHPRRGHALDPRPQPRHRGRGRAAPAPTSCGSTTSAAAPSPWTTRAISAPTS